MTPEMLEGFFKSLVGAGLDVDREKYDNARRWMAYELAYQISYNRWGQGAAKRVLNAQDTQVRTAIELLREARDPESLLAAAERYSKDGKPTKQAAALRN